MSLLDSKTSGLKKKLSIWKLWFSIVTCQGLLSEVPTNLFPFYFIVN